MPFTLDDYKKLDSRLEQITNQKVDEFELSLINPPTIDDLPDSNMAYSLKASVLFIDIRDSTQLTETSQAKNMVKIYRAFMRMAVSCVRSNGGVTRQFSGDRIMGVFLDTIDDKNLVIETSASKAVEASKSMLTCIDFSLNKQLKNNVNGKIISCGIGIDTGKVLLTKVGMYGVEKDDTKENETDCVWVGNCTNKASKYSDLTGSGEIFISSSTYKELSNDLKPVGVWNNVAKTKNGKVFNGYIAQDFYLDYSNELGESIQQISLSENEDSSNIADGIRELDMIYEKLIAKEIELKVFEEKLKSKEAKLEERENENALKKQLIEQQKELFQSEIASFYYILKEYITYSHCKSDYIEKMGIEFWEQLINNLFEIGLKIDKDKNEIIKDLACQLIGIYNQFQIYDKSFEATLMMAEKAERKVDWLSIKRNTILWAKKNNLVWKLRSIIERKLSDYSNSIDRERFRKYLQEIREIVGY